MWGQAIVISVVDPFEIHFDLLSKFRTDREEMRIFAPDSLKRALFATPLKASKDPEKL
jgi:hypothetical protein